MEKWTIEELNGIDLGDKRLEDRCKLLLERMGNRPMESIPASLKGWAETQAAYRFFDNNSVSLEKILKPHTEATIERIKQEDVVLNIQDTTLLNYSGKKSSEELGQIGEEYLRGLFVRVQVNSPGRGQVNSPLLPLTILS